MDAKEPSEQEERREYDEWALRQTSGTVAAPRVAQPVSIGSSAWLDALKRIARLVQSWDANQLGGVSQQRKRWQLLGRIAKEAIGRCVN